MTYTVSGSGDTATPAASNCVSLVCPTLRDAIAVANVATGSRTLIVFDATAFATPQTITLVGGELAMTNATYPVVITGPGKSLLTIDAANASRIFSISADVTASISGLTLANGKASTGGGILNAGTLALSDSEIKNCQATGSHNGNDGGGGIKNTRTLTSTGNTFTGNSSGARGGGIFSYNVNTYASLTVTGNTLTGNSSTSFGGGIATYDSSLTLVNSTLQGNSTPSDGGAAVDLQTSGASFVFVGNTISGNSNAAHPADSGIYCSAGVLLLYNSVVSNNGYNGASGNLFGCSNSDKGGNVVGQDGLVALAALGNYGGTMKTMPPSPGSPALCKGQYQYTRMANVTALTADIDADLRGVAINNTGGAGGYCVAGQIDSGAVQTSYTMALTTGATDTFYQTAMTPAPAVTLSENGAQASGATGTAIMTDSAGQLLTTGSTVQISSGVATFPDLRLTKVLNSDTLTATVPLNDSTTVSLFTTNALTATSGSFSVAAATPVVTTWPTASSLTYGQTLASSTLSGGVASVAGTFTWIAPSTVPPAGTTAYGVMFTPTDTNYITASSPVNVTVAKATPVVTAWPTASWLVYSQPLSSSTLTGGVASVAGSFAWTTSSTVPALGTSSQSVTFTPSDTANFTTVSGTVSVSVINPSFALEPTNGSSSGGSGTAGSGGTTATVLPGGTASYGFTLTPGSGTFPFPVTFSVTGLPVGATATFTPSMIPAGSGATPVSLGVTTPNGAVTGNIAWNVLAHKGAPLALALLLMPFCGVRRARRWFVLLLLAFAGLASSAVLTGCGGSYFSQARKSYTLTVTATSGSVQKNYTVTLNVE